ncbi:MAG: DinB family protein [Anaerolineae bacterium]|nr:DinB family protein [Anaerolineae bacterium]
MGERVDNLVARLRKGSNKALETLRGLSDEQWQTALYTEPSPWTVRDMVAHLLSSEEGLPRIAQDVAAGGPGAPQGFDYDAYNAEEQARLEGVPPKKLLANLAEAREATIAWVSELDEAILDRTGHHPALAEVTLETLINVIHGHQLMHMRDLKALLRLT